MKNRETKGFLIGIALMILSSFINAEEDGNQSIHHEWVEQEEVAVCPDGIYIDSNKGLMRLKVIDYDKENNRFLVEFPCLE